VKTIPPPAPIITSPSNNSFTNNNQPTLSGTAEPFSTVTVRDSSGNTICSGTTSGGGSWSCSPSTPLAEGAYTVTARATDRAGNTGPASTSVTFTVKTIAPSAPVIISPVSNSATNNTQPTISGTAEPFSTVAVTDSSGNVICTAVASSSGVWSCTPSSPMPEGTYTISAQATDRANNQSPASDPVVFTVTTHLPPSPIISSPSNGSRTAENPPVITGTAEPGCTVSASVDGVLVCTAVVDANGNWSCPAGSLSVGLHSVIATATNVNGISGPTSADFTLFQHVLSYKGGGLGCSATGGSSSGFGLLAILALFLLRRRVS
jgi:MYXO-CTERM domain-containing protein